MRVLGQKALIISALIVGCGDSGPADSPPPAPAENDPAFTITRVGGFYLVGNELTPGQDELEIEATGPEGTEHIDVWLDGSSGTRLDRLDSSFGARIDIGSLEAGSHELIFAANGNENAFARVEFQRSHPLYVVVSTDWDDPDNTDHALQLQEELHERHAELKITHLVGPYTFTEPEMTSERKTLQIEWVKGMRDNYGDEIGLHIHPYCSFVESSGIPCLDKPSVVSGADETGYSVMCSAYSEDEFTTLLEHADELFVANGLGKPTSFRAGGWTADRKVLGALARAGYVADSSANNWARMEEWKGQANGVLYEWNAANWASIGDTSQPYYPSKDDILKPGDDFLAVLEVPDNGILVDYVTTDEMIEIFEANWDGTALHEPVNYSIGWHPSNFNQDYRDRMNKIMNRLDRFLASRHDGPVVYETLSNMVKVWPLPQ